jgi:hypothetical protein
VEAVDDRAVGLELTDIVYTSGSLEEKGEPMTERELSRAAASDSRSSAMPRR